MIKLPLILRVDIYPPYNARSITDLFNDRIFAETKRKQEIFFILGETVQDLEKIGRLTLEYTKRPLPSVYYFPYQTRKINSFYETIKSKETVTSKMNPGEQICLGTLDSIGWGYDEPLISIEYKDLIPNKK